MVITVVIDDEDPSIKYAGDWKSNYSSYDQNNTVHSTFAVGAQAIYKFRGSSVSVFGSLARGATPLMSFSVDDPELGDPVLIGKPSAVQSLTRQHFYTSPGLDPFKEHALMITVVNATQTGFWLDYLQVVQEANTTNTPDTLPQTSTSVALLSSPSAASSTVTSTISSSPMSVPSNMTLLPSTGDFTDPSATGVETATHSLSSDPPLNPANQPNGRIIGVAVGSAVGGLALLVALVALLRAFRRRAKKRMHLSSSRRVTAFLSTSGYRDTTSTSPTSELLHRQYEPGYTVQGGLSKEKITSRPRQPDYQNRGNVISELLPPYQSDYGDAAPPGPFLPT